MSSKIINDANQKDAMQIYHASGKELEDFSLESRVLRPKSRDESSFSLATLMPFI